MPRNKGQKILIILILFLAIGGSRPAQAEIDPSFRPASPQILGQGGCPAATASGYGALFVNPSGFASSGGSFTFYGSSFWLYADPLPALRAIVDPDSSALQNFIEDQMTSGGFGFDSSDGIGYVGRGIAAALITIDAYLWGATVGTAAGELTLTLAFISGFAYPFQVKEARVIRGMDVRPMIRIWAPIDHLVMQDFLDALRSEGNPLTNLNSTDALHGYVLAIDLGALVEGGGLRWGVAIRDFLGTRFNYRMDPFGDILTSLRENGGFPTGGAAVDDHLIPMDVSSGFAYNFDFGDSKVVTDLVLCTGDYAISSRLPLNGPPRQYHARRGGDRVVPHAQAARRIQSGLPHLWNGRKALAAGYQPGPFHPRNGNHEHQARQPGVDRGGGAPPLTATVSPYLWQLSSMKVPAAGRGG